MEGGTEPHSLPATGILSGSDELDRDSAAPFVSGLLDLFLKANQAGLGGEQNEPCGPSFPAGPAAVSDEIAKGESSPSPLRFHDWKITRTEVCNYWGFPR